MLKRVFSKPSLLFVGFALPKTVKVVYSAHTSVYSHMSRVPPFAKRMKSTLVDGKSIAKVCWNSARFEPEKGGKGREPNGLIPNEPRFRISLEAIYWVVVPALSRVFRLRITPLAAGHTGKEVGGPVLLCAKS